MTSVQGSRCALQASCLLVLALMLGVSASATPPVGEKPAPEKPFDPTEVPTVKWLPKPVPVPDADAETEARMKAYTEVVQGTEAKFDMVPIPGGKFMMGSPCGEEDRQECEGPRHEVAVDPFWMGKHEVTWDEFELWSMGLDVRRRTFQKVKPTGRDTLADAITRPTMPYSDMSFDMGKKGRPAICMTQLAAKLYCKWLSAKTGRYYRLPTEAEWEYACRAGTKTAYSFGDDPEKLGEYGWCFDNSDDEYQKVGKKKPNPWGLYDMHGNVAEWVLDQLVPDLYKQSAGKLVTNPLAVPKELYPRVVRGGSWVDDPEALRSAARAGSEKSWKDQDPQIPQSIWYHTDADFVGFRVVRPLKVPSAEKSKLYEPKTDVIREYQEARGGAQ